MKKKTQLFIILLSFYLSANCQRNTIIIIADDLSPDYFGFYENSFDTVDVPNIRSLLARGIRFKYLLSNPVCSSTRTTILTGRYSFRTGVGGIVGGIGGSNQIDTSEISIPKLLRIYDNNIVKANIGKWHLKQPNPAINLTSPLALGYNWCEGPFIGQLQSFINWTKYTNGVASTVTTYATTENVNNAVSWLKNQNTNKPFFLWLAFNAPHEPLHLPPLNLHTYTNLSGTLADVNAQPKQYFKAMIQAMDHEIGRLFDTLKVMNKFDSTDIIFIGDNGNTPRTAQISDLSKAKGTVYQYGVHVPMIIAGPSVVNKGRVSNALVNTVDIFATIVENFGYKNWQSEIPTNKPVDSKSLQPIITNTADSVRPWVFSEIFKLTTDSADGKGMRNRDYKLIRFEYGAEEFYRLTDDPNESKNLLIGTLTPTDISNYNYLCTEMNKLLGNNLFCQKTVSLNEDRNIENSVFDIYPNPSNLFIHLKFSKELIGKCAVEFIDITGKTCLKLIDFSPNINNTIDISTLSKGMYNVNLKYDIHSYSKKLILE